MGGLSMCICSVYAAAHPSVPAATHACHWTYQLTSYSRTDSPGSVASNSTAPSATATLFAPPTSCNCPTACSFAVCSSVGCAGDPSPSTPCTHCCACRRSPTPAHAPALHPPALPALPPLPPPPDPARWCPGSSRPSPTRCSIYRRRPIRIRRATHTRLANRIHRHRGRRLHLHSLAAHLRRHAKEVQHGLVDPIRRQRPESLKRISPSNSNAQDNIAIKLMSCSSAS